MSCRVCLFAPGRVGGARPWPSQYAGAQTKCCRGWAVAHDRPKNRSSELGPQKARVFSSFGSDFRSGSDIRGPETIRRIAPGCRKSAPRPKSGPEKRKYRFRGLNWVPMEGCPRGCLQTARIPWHKRVGRFRASGGGGDDNSSHGFRETRQFRRPISVDVDLFGVVFARFRAISGGFGRLSGELDQIKADFGRTRPNSMDFGHDLAVSARFNATPIKLGANSTHIGTSGRIRLDLAR